MLRRELLKTAGAVALSRAASPFTNAMAQKVPVIDSHIHLFDPTRPEGVPWPDKSDTIRYKPALPTQYQALAEPHGVVGAIAIECSPWRDDNSWLEKVVEKNPIMLGYIGNLVPSDPSFAATLSRFHRSPLFLGIRYGNLWNRNLLADAQTFEFIAGLKLLAEASLVLETANPNADLISAVLKISDRLPDLRIVIDHLPHADIPKDQRSRAEYETHLHELAGRPHVFVKASEILKLIDGKVSFDLGAYKSSLDAIWNLFGEDRILFGSDWPNSNALASYSETFGIAQKYIVTRSKASQAKYYWKNSATIYKWKPRMEAQRRLIE